MKPRKAHKGDRKGRVRKEENQESEVICRSLLLRDTSCGSISSFLEVALIKNELKLGVGIPSL
jgi:hypothetical protein